MRWPGIPTRGAAPHVWDKGHSDAWDVHHGPVVTLNASIVHDDWKPISQCVIGEAQCLQRERDWIRVHKGGLVRWLRVRPVLRKFWRAGKLVANRAHRHRYQDNFPPEYKIR